LLMGRKKKERKKEDITLWWNNKFRIREKPGKFKDINRIRKEISVYVCVFFFQLWFHIYSHEYSFFDDVLFPFLFCLTLSIDFKKSTQNTYSYYINPLYYSTESIELSTKMVFSFFLK
jgi:hypothetical protein